jgi:hypothetical protein
MFERFEMEDQYVFTCPGPGQPHPFRIRKDVGARVTVCKCGQSMTITQAKEEMRRILSQKSERT